MSDEVSFDSSGRMIFGSRSSTSPDSSRPINMDRRNTHLGDMSVDGESDTEMMDWDVSGLIGEPSTSSDSKNDIMSEDDAAERANFNGSDVDPTYREAGAVYRPTVADERAAKKAADKKAAKESAAPAVTKLTNNNPYKPIDQTAPALNHVDTNAKSNVAPKELSEA